MLSQEVHEFQFTNPCIVFLLSFKRRSVEGFISTSQLILPANCSNIFADLLPKGNMKKFVHLVWKSFALSQTIHTQKKRYAFAFFKVIVSVIYATPTSHILSKRRNFSLKKLLYQPFFPQSLSLFSHLK